MEFEDSEIPLAEPEGGFGGEKLLTLKIGIIYNLKREGEEKSDDQAEYDNIETIHAIRGALTKAGYKAVLIEADNFLAENLKKHKIDFAFNIAEGWGGRSREGQAPAVFDLLSIPFTGSDATTLCVSLDKALSKRIVSAAKVRTPGYAVIAKGERVNGLKLKYPVIVKPNAEGSGKGIGMLSVAKNKNELNEILDRNFALYSGEMLIEEYIAGREFTVGVLGNGKNRVIFEPMEILYKKPLPGNFNVYSYEVKQNYTEYVEYKCPANLEKTTRDELISFTEKSCKALGCLDFARADYRVDEKGKVYFIEINPLPGLAPGYSDYPMLAGFSGVGYDKLIAGVLNAAIERYKNAGRNFSGVADNKANACPKTTSFDDWKWQFSNRITNAQKLSKYISIDEDEKEEITSCLKDFRMAATPYYASLIDPNDKNDPIRKQCVPTSFEKYVDENDLTDPLGEENESPAPHIVHRYPDRVLFLVTCKCSVYCRHCTRRRIVGEEDRVITEKDLSLAVKYIKSKPAIRDVLISGGDPLTMSTERLEHIIKAIREIPHIEIIRIGTRVPVVMPMRITDELLGMLKKYHPIWINTHFNHPREITPYSAKACAAIVDAGIPLGNQTVLLKGVNDDINVMKELMLKLVKMRVRPYYLYQCDPGRGISHFRTSVQTGIDIVHGLQGYISGFAVPKFVIDAPGGGGKVPVSYNYVISKTENEVVLENWSGGKYSYLSPSGSVKKTL
ncbi:MAG: KamA family radical SAM protein [Eubacteriales bacterium]